MGEHCTGGLLSLRTEIRAAGSSTAASNKVAFLPSVMEYASRREGYLFEPTRKRHWFHYAHDPTANEGNGKITVQIDNDQFTLDVPPELRNGPCNFDRFGIMNARTGGKVVEVYLDDLSYTARPPDTDQRHRRKVETVPYPDGGRRY